MKRAFVVARRSKRSSQPGCDDRQPKCEALIRESAPTSANETVLAVVEKRWDAFSAPWRVALEFTETPTALPPEIAYERAPQCVPDELPSRVTAIFTDEQLVELTMSISMWNALARNGFELASHRKGERVLKAPEGGPGQVRTFAAIGRAPSRDRVALTEQYEQRRVVAKNGEVANR